MVITGKILCSAIMVSTGVFGVGGKTRACHFSSHVVKYSKQYKIDPYLLTALIQVESNWKQHVVLHCNIHVCPFSTDRPSIRCVFKYISLCIFLSLYMCL